MSPELINIKSSNYNIGKFDAEKCDIFSLGLTLYRLLT